MKKKPFSIPAKRKRRSLRSGGLGGDLSPQRGSGRSPESSRYFMQSKALGACLRHLSGFSRSLAIWVFLQLKRTSRLPLSWWYRSSSTFSNPLNCLYSLLKEWKLNVWMPILPPHSHASKPGEFKILGGKEEYWDTQWTHISLLVLCLQWYRFDLSTLDHSVHLNVISENSPHRFRITFI